MKKGLSFVLVVVFIFLVPSMYSQEISYKTCEELECSKQDKICAYDQDIGLNCVNACKDDFGIPISEFDSCTLDNRFCDSDGELTFDCELCGCPQGYACEADNSCVQICNDGTKSGQCSDILPKYCEEGVLIDNSQVCGCSEDMAPQDNGKCGYGNTLIDSTAENFQEGDLNDNFEIIYGNNLAFYGTAFASSTFDAPSDWSVRPTPNLLNDGVLRQYRWISGSNSSQYIGIEWDSPRLFNEVVITQDKFRIISYKVQVEKDGKWVDATGYQKLEFYPEDYSNDIVNGEYTNNDIKKDRVTFDPVTSKKVRVFISRCVGGCLVNELEVFNSPETSIAKKGYSNEFVSRILDTETANNDVYYSNIIFNYSVDSDISNDNNIAGEGTAIASSANNDGFGKANIIDNDYGTYWSPSDPPEITYVSSGSADWVGIEWENIRSISKIKVFFRKPEIYCLSQLIFEYHDGTDWKLMKYSKKASLNSLGYPCDATEFDASKDYYTITELFDSIKTKKIRIRPSSYWKTNKAYVTEIEVFEDIYVRKNLAPSGKVVVSSTAFSLYGENNKAHLNDNNIENVILKNPRDIAQQGTLEVGSCHHKCGQIGGVGNWLFYDKNAINNDDIYGPDYGSAHKRAWRPAGAYSDSWFTLEYPEQHTFTKLDIYQIGDRIENYRIKYWEDGQWKYVSKSFPATGVWSLYFRSTRNLAKPITTNKIGIQIDSSYDNKQIYIAQVKAYASEIIPKVWKPSASDPSPSAYVEFSEEKAFDRVDFIEETDNIKNYDVMYWEEKEYWKELETGHFEELETGYWGNETGYWKELSTGQWELLDNWRWKELSTGQWEVPASQSDLFADLSGRAHQTECKDDYCPSFNYDSVKFGLSSGRFDGQNSLLAKDVPRGKDRTYSFWMKEPNAQGIKYLLSDMSDLGEDDIRIKLNSDNKIEVELGKITEQESAGSIVNNEQIANTEGSLSSITGAAVGTGTETTTGTGSDKEIGRAPEDGNGASLPGVDTSGLVLLMHMNNEAGESDTLVKDYSIEVNNERTGQQGNDGSIVNSLTLEEGKFSNSYHFPKINNYYIKVDDNPSLDITQSLTINTWVRIDSTPDYGRIVAKGSNGDSSTFSYGIWMGGNTILSPNKFRFVTQSDSLESSTNLNDNEWYMLTAIYDGTSKKLYINGNLDSSKPYSIDLVASSHNLAIGYDENRNGFPFGGNIDELAIWNRALTPLEINNLYERGADTGTETNSYSGLFQITSDNSYQQNPDIYNNKIVWEDERNGNWDIYMYDLDTKQETQITSDSHTQNYPTIHNNKIVWRDYRNGNWDIYMYDLDTKQETRITSDTNHQFDPEIYNNKIVWTDMGNGHWDIYMYDLDTNEETQITTNTGYQSVPAIHNNKIVWQDMRNGNTDIYMYDLDTKQETQITSGTNHQFNPAIYNNKIFWNDNRNGKFNDDIYMYDLDTKQETQITSDTNRQFDPAIYNNKIVWQDNRNGNWDIYMYDLDTKQETQITFNANIQSNPAIYNNKIVWTDFRNGNGDIYMASNESYERGAGTSTGTGSDKEIGRAPEDGNGASLPGIDTNNLVLLMHFNNEEGESNSLFKDFSSEENNLRTISYDGTCSIDKCPSYDTTNTKFGESSLKFYNDLIKIPDSADWDFGNEDFTISTWVYRLGGSFGVILDRRTGPKYESWVLDDRLFGTIFTDGSKMWDNELWFSGLEVNKWQHIVVKRSNGIFKLYIDGVEDNSFDATGKTMQSFAHGLNIGSDSTGRESFDGYIDELAIWRRSLSDGEINNLYERGTGTSTETSTGTDTDTGTETNTSSGTKFSFEIYQITSDNNEQNNPDIYNNKIVWQDARNGKWDIYMYDLDTKQETQITSVNNHQQNPNIHNNKIVWQDLRNGYSPDIYMHYLDIKYETPITSDTNGQSSPAIHNNKIVWQDNRNGNFDIYMYDLDTNEETRITSDITSQFNPAIHNNKIVWEDVRNGSWDIYMYDLDTKLETQITTNSGNQRSPSVYNNIIIWQDGRNGNFDIYMYDLDTNEETRITSNNNEQSNPAIHNNIIVWRDKRNGNFDIYMYDLDTKRETQITNDTNFQSNPAIHNNKIVWQDNRDGDLNIYMASISQESTGSDKGAAFNLVSKEAVLENEWNHISFVIDAENKIGSLYVNGELSSSSALDPGYENSSSNKGSVCVSASSFDFCGQAPDIVDNFIGLIDELIITKRALSPSEIQSLYERNTLDVGERNTLKITFNDDRSQNGEIWVPDKEWVQDMEWIPDKEWILDKVWIQDKVWIPDKILVVEEDWRYLPAKSLNPTGSKENNLVSFELLEPIISNKIGIKIKETFDDEASIKELYTIGVPIIPPIDTSRFNVQLQVRSAPNVEGEIGEWTAWTGPDGSTNTYFNGSAQEVPEIHNENKYLQYKAKFNSPVSYSAGPKQILKLNNVEVDYSGKFNIKPTLKAKNYESTVGEIMNYSVEADDLGGNIVKYEWELENGTILTGKEVNVTYDIPAKRVEKVTITDDNGAKASKYFTSNAVLFDCLTNSPSGSGSAAKHFNVDDPVLKQKAQEAILEYANAKGISAEQVDSINEIYEAGNNYLTSHMTYTQNQESDGWEYLDTSAYKLFSYSDTRGCGNDYCGDCEDYAYANFGLLRAMGVSEKCVYVMRSPTHMFNVILIDGRYRILEPQTRGLASYYDSGKRWVGAHEPYHLFTDYFGEPRKYTNSPKIDPYTYTLNYPSTNAMPDPNKKCSAGDKKLTYYEDICP